MINIKKIVLRDEASIIDSWLCKNEVLVSVVCTTYNHEKYIEDAIISFLMQETSFPFEIIVHDDASTDSTAAVINKYYKGYPNIIKPIFQSTNQYSKGKFRPMLYASGFAKGKYLAMCEGDDFWGDSKKLETQYQFLEDNPDYSMCFHGYSYIDSNSAFTGEPDKNYRDLSSFDLISGQFVHINTILCRNVINDINHEAKNVTQGDQFILSRLGLSGRGKYLAEIKDSAYRIHETGVWSTLDESSKHAKVMETYFWIAKYYRRIGKPEFAGFYEHKICQLILNRSLDTPSLKTALIALFPRQINAYRQWKRRRN